MPSREGVLVQNNKAPLQRDERAAASTLLARCEWASVPSRESLALSGGVNQTRSSQERCEGKGTALKYVGHTATREMSKVPNLEEREVPFCFSV